MNSCFFSQLAVLEGERYTDGPFIIGFGILGKRDVPNWEGESLSSSTSIQLKQMLPPSRPYLDAIIDGAGGDIVSKAVKLLKVRLSRPSLSHPLHTPFPLVFTPPALSHPSPHSSVPSSN